MNLKNVGVISKITDWSNCCEKMSLLLRQTHESALLSKFIKAAPWLVPIRKQRLKKNKIKEYIDD